VRDALRRLDGSSHEERDLFASLAERRERDVRLDAKEQIVPEARSRLNACGGGAIAAMLSAARELGATRADVLRHNNSFETLANVRPQRPVDAVGYAAVIVG